MAHRLLTDGSTEEFFGGFADLKQAIGGGYVEAVYLRDCDRFMLVDEEGSLHSDKVQNLTASVLYQMSTGIEQNIYGDAVVMTPQEWNIVGNGGVI